MNECMHGLVPTVACRRKDPVPKKPVDFNCDSSRDDEHKFIVVLRSSDMIFQKTKSRENLTNLRIKYSIYST